MRPACSRRHRDGRRLVPAGLAVALVLALAGCGSSDAREDRGPRRSAEATVKAWATTQSVAARCGQAVTQRYLRATYGDVQGCRRREAATADSNALAPGVRQDIVTRGDHARADVALAGGHLNGAHGTIALVEDDGTWRIDAIGTDLLRSIYSHSVLHQLRLTADAPGLRPEAARRCVDTRIADQSARVVRAAWEGDDAAAEDLVAGTLTNCLNTAGTGPDGMSYLRARLLDTLASTFAQAGLRGAELACARRDVRAKLTDREVLEHVLRDTAAPPPATTRLARLVLGCRR